MTATAEEIKAFKEYLEKRSQELGVKIRIGTKEDCKEVARLIQELADFEKMPNGPKIDYQVLEKDGFESNPPLYQIIVVEEPNEGQNTSSPTRLIAYALYYNKYSTWMGKAMLLEDLYCSPEYRSKKIGSALFRAVVKLAVLTGCQQMDWEVLAWNPAKQFYDRHGAIDITETDSWHFYRLKKDAMLALEG